MARDKFYEARIAGYIAAYQKAKQDGLEALGRDIKKRNMLKADLNVSEKQMNEMYQEFSTNCYNNMLVGILYALHDSLQFGKTRIKRVKQAFDELVMDTMDLDYMGNHYIRLEDFAVELNEKYDLGIDISRVAACEEVFDQRRSDFHYCKVEIVIRELKEHGFADAALFLEKKLD